MEIYVKCDACQLLSVYHGQYRCEHCAHPFNNWSIADQLRKSRDDEFLTQFSRKCPFCESRNLKKTGLTDYLYCGECYKLIKLEM